MNVKGKSALGMNTVRRLVNKEKEETDLSDRSSRGRPAAVMNENKAKQAEALIIADGIITARKLCEKLSGEQ